MKEPWGAEKCQLTETETQKIRLTQSSTLPNEENNLRRGKKLEFLVQGKK